MQMVDRNEIEEIRSVYLKIQCFEDNFFILHDSKFLGIIKAKTNSSAACCGKSESYR
jgi:hypothetical protein